MYNLLYRGLTEKILVKPGLFGLGLADHGANKSAMTFVWILAAGNTAPQPVNKRGVWTSDGVWNATAVWYA